MVCLDTTFLIDAILGRELDKKFNGIFEGKESLTVASPSIMELIRGIHLKKNTNNIKENEIEKINSILSSLNVLKFDKNSAILAGKIEAELDNAGQKIDIEDIMIASIAIENNETLITRNKKHFEKIKGLKVEYY